MQPRQPFARRHRRRMRPDTNEAPTSSTHLRRRRDSQKAICMLISHQLRRRVLARGTSIASHIAATAALAMGCSAPDPAEVSRDLVDDGIQPAPHDGVPGPFVPTNHAGCDVIRNSCANTGACCDVHDRCITSNACTGACATPIGILPLYCSPACTACQQQVILCYASAAVSPVGPSACCNNWGRGGNVCGLVQQCAYTRRSEFIVETDPCECQRLGLAHRDACFPAARATAPMVGDP